MEGNPRIGGLTKFADLVEKKGGGKIVVKVFTGAGSTASRKPAPCGTVFAAVSETFSLGACFNPRP